MKFSEFKEPLWILVFIFFILEIFTRNLMIAIKLFLGFSLLIYIPGYCLSMYILTNSDQFEKSILAIFLGMGIIPIIAYALSIVKIKTVSPIFAIIIAAIAMTMIIKRSLKLEKSTIRKMRT